MCFPHVDEETRSVLQSVMDEAENYADFAERLCHKVCTEPTPPLLQFFAYYFAWYISEIALLDRLADADRVTDLAVPLHMVSSASRGEISDWNDMTKSLRKALDISPNDWIAILLYLAWRWPAESQYPETDVDIRPIETIERSVSENEELEYFETYLYGMKAVRLHREGSLKEANVAITKAITVSRKFEDLIGLAYLLRLKANIVKHTDLRKAIDVLLTSRDLCNLHDYRQCLGLVHGELGHIMGLRGELDAAIDYQLEMGSIKEAIGLPVGNHNAVIASYYNMMGNGRKALKFTELAVEWQDISAHLTRFVPFPHTQKAWALINLGRINEAKDELHKSKEFVPKTGDLCMHIYSKLVEGILEKVEGNHDSAVQVFEEVLRSQEQDPFPLWQNICLLNLVEIEIEKQSPESIDPTADSSGPWMERLDEHARKNDLPGIAARSLILKASLRKKQGRHDEVQSLLKEVLKTAESPSMRYLKNIIASTFPDVIVS